MPLTDSKLKALHAKKRKHTTEIPDRDGLVISCGLSGKLSWVYRYRFNGQQKRLTFGSYPALSLPEARNKTIEYLRIVEGKEDPKHYTDLKKFISIEDCANEWLKKVETLRGRTQTVYKSNINKYLTIKRFPHDIQKARFEYWLAYFDKIAKENSRVTSGSIYKTINSMLKWCKSRNFIQSSTFFEIQFNAVGAQPSRGERNLQLHELGMVWVEIGRTKATPAIKLCSKLLIIFGARNSEVREAKRSEFDLDRGVWTLPASRSKTKKDVRRAIPELAKAIIIELDETYGGVFLIPGVHKKTCMTAHSLNRYITRLWLKLHTKHKIEKFTPHDFRRTLSTRLSEKEVLPHVSEKMLGHELGGIMAVYNKHDWIDEQLKAYELYCQMIKEAASTELSRTLSD